MSRSSAAPLAYDPVTGTYSLVASDGTSAYRLLGQGQGRPGGPKLATAKAPEWAPARQVSTRANLDALAGAAYDAGDYEGYYGTGERPSRLKIRHPQWLVATVAVVLLAALALPAFAAMRAGHSGSRWSLSTYTALAAAASSAQPAEPPVIDATSKPQGDASRSAPAPSGKYALTGAPSISVQKIEEVLKQYGSAAAGHGQALYDLGVRYGIDPAYALAFFVHESGCGTRGVARFTKSLGNIRWTAGYDNYEGYRSYSTWEQGMEDWYKLITELYVNGWGLRTVDAVIPVYAPYADNNNPPAYAASIKWMVDTWRGK